VTSDGPASARFARKTAIITGASRGIGLAVAERLVAEGATVVITARKEATLCDAVAALGGPTRAVGIAGRADDPEHRAHVVRTAVESFGGAHLLVNNAGINPIMGPLIETDLTAARKIIEVNALGALGWVQEVCSAWMNDHGGAILNVSSVAGTQPTRAIGMYGASKAMLNYITQQLAVELGPSIRVNAIAPAVVKTAFGSPLYAGREDEVAATYPLKRLGEAADISSAAAFLLSEEASWITGRVVVIDGGVTLIGRE
jgi:3-oxoacyl-[acyl-carrier protein] reductase